MRTADRDPDLEPKRVPDRSVFRQEVFFILQNHGVVAQMIADLRPECHVAPPVPVKICQSVLPIVGGLLVVILAVIITVIIIIIIVVVVVVVVIIIIIIIIIVLAATVVVIAVVIVVVVVAADVETERQPLGNVLHSVVLPDEFTAGAIVSGIVVVVDDVLKLGAYFRSAVLTSDNATFTIFLESPANSGSCSVVSGQPFPVNPPGSQTLSDFRQWWPFSFTNSLAITPGADAYLYFMVANAHDSQVGCPSPTGLRVEVL
jgi:hypothetical protein